MHKYELVAIGLDPDDPFRFESSLSSNISSFKIENLLDGMNYEIKLNAIPISKSINSPPNIVAVEAMTEYAPPILKTKYVGIDTFIFGWEAPRVPNLSLALRYMSFDSQGSTTVKSGDRPDRIGSRFSKFCWSWFGPVLDFEIIFEIS